MESFNNESKHMFNRSVDMELGEKNITNILKLSKSIKEEALKQNIDTHLILVGGMVDPKKQGKFHKDIDLVLYSSQLATKFYTGGECPEFDNFTTFIAEVANKIGWSINIEKPYFQDYQFSGDGKVVLSTDHKPIEVLPVRSDSLSNSFENYIKNTQRPLFVIH